MRFNNMFILLIFVACWVFYAPQALAGVNVYVAGKSVPFDVPPIVDTSSNRTLVPFRHIFEALGAEVWFDNRVNAAFGKKGDLTIELPMNQKVAYKNNEHIQLDVATQVVNGRTMVPLRFISESLGCRVDAHNTPDGLRVDITWLEPDRPEEVTLSNERTLTDISTTISDTELVIELTVEDGLNKVFILRSPERLVLDLQNTTNRAAEKVNLEHPLVSAIRTGQLNNETTRVVLDLKGVISYHFEKDNDSLLITVADELSATAGATTTGEPAGRPAQPVLVPDEQLIILDAGHGGRDIGATGVSGKYEKDLVLTITNQLKTALEDEGYNVILTRSDDTYVSLDERVAIADRTNAFAFVSIHANSTANNAAVQGVEIYKYYGSDSRLAQHVLEGILERTGQNNRKVKEAGFYVIKNTLMPAILIEIGFISNSWEEAFLWEPNNQADIVKGIVAGIMAYQGR